MSATLDSIRSSGERRLAADLEKLDAKHRAMLREAVRTYGSVAAIPETIWRDINGDTERALAAYLLWISMESDLWTSGEIASQGRQYGLAEQPAGKAEAAGYSITAAGRAVQTSLEVTDATRSRFKREIENARLGPQGDVGDLTDEGIDEALDKTFTPERREATAANETTSGISSGQTGAADRYYEPGAGASIEIDMIWQTEGDNRVCPRCAPLNEKTEDVWGVVFPDGPGPDAHPNCRCWLRPQVRPKEPTQ